MSHIEINMKTLLPPGFKKISSNMGKGERKDNEGDQFDNARSKLVFCITSKLGKLSFVIIRQSACLTYQFKQTLGS